MLSNPLRYAFDASAQAATQFAGTFDPDKPPVADDDEPGLEGQDFYSPTQATFANGMHAAIVETDPVTAEIRILRYCVVHDCGVMVNPMIVEGQVHGGVAQGVGGALYERMAYDESGSCSTPRSWTSSSPTPPRSRTSRPTTSRPRARSTRSGIKGAGEAGTIPVTAVIASALEDAEGFPIRSMPISPSELWDAPPAARRRRRRRRRRPLDHRTRSRAGRLAMKISGSSTLDAPVEKVWEAIQDPAVLARCIPGCESLTTVADDRYAMSVTAGRRRHQGHLRR